MTTDYLCEKYNRYRRWAIGLGIPSIALILGLIASAVAFNYWDSQPRSTCNLACMDAGVASFVFVIVTALGLLILAPMAAYCAYKLRKIRRKITLSNTHEAATNAREMVQKITQV